VIINLVLAHFEQIFVESIALSAKQAEAQILPLLPLSADNTPTWLAPHEEALTQLFVEFKYNDELHFEQPEALLPIVQVKHVDAQALQVLFPSGAN